MAQESWEFAIGDFPSVVYQSGAANFRPTRDKLTRITPTYPPLPLKLTRGVNIPLLAWPQIGLGIVILGFCFWVFWKIVGTAFVSTYAPTIYNNNGEWFESTGNQNTFRMNGCNPLMPRYFGHDKPAFAYRRCFNATEKATRGNMVFAGNGPEHYQLWRTFSSEPRELIIPFTVGCIYQDVVPPNALKIETLANSIRYTPLQTPTQPVRFYWTKAACPN